MYQSSDFVTVYNRSSKVLKGTWNGRHFEVKPGKNAYPLLVAEAIKRQNPIMGTQYGNNPLDAQFLVGIEELGDDCSPIEQSGKAELVDPVELHGTKETRQIVGTTGLYGRSSVHVEPPSGPVESSFEKP